MNSGSYLMQDNLRGMLISQRPNEIEAFKYSRINPFISRVTNKDPLGLPPIKRSVVYEHVKKPNYVEMKNKEIVKKIQNLKKLERTLIQDEEIHLKTKQKKIKEKFDKQNTNINEIRKELYGINNENLNSKSTNNMLNTASGFAKGGGNDKIEGTNYLKLNSEYHDLNMPPIVNKNMKEEEEVLKVAHNKDQSNIASKDNDKNFILNNGSPDVNINLDEEENEDEIKNLLKFVNNLDYEKYLKDLEIREALYLIKNKVEKEGPLETNDNLNNKESEENNQLIGSQFTNQEGEMGNNNENKKVNFQFAPSVVSHDKEWDNSTKPQIDTNQNNNLNSIEEMAKRTVAKNILKKDKNLRSIHSYNSVKKLLEREGLTSPTKLNTLRISVLKEKDGINNYDYIPSLLPSLHDQPII